jgi:hypothetical protein
MSTPTYVNVSSLITMPTSGGWEIGTVTRRIQRVQGKKSDCEAAAPVRGMFGTGDFGGWVVDQVTIEPDRGGLATMEIRYVATLGSGAPLPEDEWRLEPFEDNPRIERHPRYAGLNGEALQNVQTAVQGLDQDQRDEAYDDLDATGKELVDKMRRGMESYYRAALRYVWVTSSYTPPIPIAAGYVETPGGPGSIWLPPGYDWLRQADGVDYLNGVYRITSTWIGAPSGHWDDDIYT